MNQYILYIYLSYSHKENGGKGGSSWSKESLGTTFVWIWSSKLVSVGSSRSFNFNDTDSCNFTGSHTWCIVWWSGSTTAVSLGCAFICSRSTWWSFFTSCWFVFFDISGSKGGFGGSTSFFTASFILFSFFCGLTIESIGGSSLFIGFLDLDEISAFNRFWIGLALGVYLFIPFVELI